MLRLGYSDEFLLGKVIFFFNSYACMMKLEWGKKGEDRGCEKIRCLSWPGAAFEKLRPPHGRFGHTFGVFSPLVGGQKTACQEGT